MVNQSMIDRVWDDIKYQTPRFKMLGGYCEVSMMLLNIIHEMNKEYEALEKRIKRLEDVNNHIRS